MDRIDMDDGVLLTNTIIKKYRCKNNHEVETSIGINIGLYYNNVLISNTTPCFYCLDDILKRLPQMVEIK